MNPPPVDSSLRIAPKLTVHILPLLVCARGDVSMEKTWPHLTHEACIITARPEGMISPSRVHFPPHSTLCAFNIPMES